MSSTTAVAGTVTGSCVVVSAEESPFTLTMGSPAVAHAVLKKPPTQLAFLDLVMPLVVTVTVPPAIETLVPKPVQPVPSFVVSS
jgi:hypothetical protein